MRSRRAVLLVALAGLWIACNEDSVVEPDVPEVAAPQLNKTDPAPAGEPQTSGAENATEILYACYNPSGAVYRIKTEDPDEECHSPSHVMFSWNAEGPEGPPGAAGADGLHCWDLNGNGVADLPDEDVNGDKVVDVLDCKGDKGDKGDPGPVGPRGDPGVLGFYTRSHTYTMPNNWWQWFTLSCNPGDIVISGGFRRSADGPLQNFYVTHHGPVGSTAYKVGITNTSGSSETITWYAICADMSSSLSVESDVALQSGGGPIP